MIENIKANEQKLEEIYQIVKSQQAAATRAKWLRLFKWIIILVVVYYVAQNPTVILEKVTETVMPGIMENMKTMMTDDLMKQVQDVLPKQ